MCEVCLADVCVWSMNNRTKKKSAELIELQSWTKQNGKFQPVQMKDGKMARFVVRGFNLDFVGAMRCLFSGCSILFSPRLQSLYLEQNKWTI